jgi:hypothetical protein
MDSAGIILFAFGKELLSDIGYTHTRYRNWTINSASHNMVVVDQRSQPLEYNNATMTGNVLFFEDSHPRVRVVDLDAQPAYPHCAVYRRRLAHVHVAEGRDYLVDWFDIEGGAVHDYFLHGSADEEGVLETNVPLDHEVPSLVPGWGGTTELTGENCLDISGEKHHPYISLWNIRSSGDPAAPPPDGTPQLWTATWRYGAVGLRSHLFPEPRTVLFRFQAPSVRKAGRDDAKLRDYVLNGIMQRHAGSISRFRAVHVPFQGEPWIDGVQYKGETFTIPFDTETHKIRWNEDGLAVTSSAGWEYNSGALITGRIAGVERGDTFALRADRDVPDVPLIRLDFGGERSMVYRVQGTRDKSFILHGDPGFAYDPAIPEVRFLYHPHEVFPGPLTWTAWE